MKSQKPLLITFDIFGTVLDWRTGMQVAVSEAGLSLSDRQFDQVVDRQAKLEQERFLPYSEITALSLIEVLGMPQDKARSIGNEVGLWPLYPDSRVALSHLMRLTECGATTNSDLAHGEQVQRQLGFKLTHWLCAEDIKAYKPSRKMWEEMSRKTGMGFNKSWWHVSAYADYDIEMARELGLTTVFIDRPHSRKAPADYQLPNLLALSSLLGALT